MLTQGNGSNTPKAGRLGVTKDGCFQRGTCPPDPGTGTESSTAGCLRTWSLRELVVVVSLSREWGCRKAEVDSVFTGSHGPGAGDIPPLRPRAGCRQP